MENKFSKFLSYLFHPLLVPTYGYIVLFNSNIFLKHVIPSEAKLLIISLIFINTFVLPFMFIFMLYKYKVVQSIELNSKNERKIPYFITFIFYLTAYYILSKNGLPLLIQIFMLGSVILLFAIFCINFFWKISAHLMGLGALSGSIYALGIRFEANVNTFFIWSILLSGLVAYSRIKLEAHTSMQVYAGFILGFICQYIMITQFV